MEGRVFLATFVAVFFAELADKTQLVGIGMASKTGKPVLVWFASVCAYALVTILSVFLGVALSRFANPLAIRIIGAGLFIVLGILMIFKAL
jgi:putative Ca2+/H+ antiporter (TMEM165/GDT1 family)